MKRILIVRTSAIGDVVLASPMADAIRRAHPDAHVAWLVQAEYASLIAHDPAINEIIPWPRGQWLRDAKAGRVLALRRSIVEFRRALRERAFDTAINLQGLLKSGFLTWLSGAPRRVGLSPREGSRVFHTERLDAPASLGRIGGEYRALAEHLGLDAGAFIPTLHVSPEAERRALDRLAGHGVGPGAFAVFAPHTTRPQKHWFGQSWRELAPRIRGEFGLVPVLLGSPGDRPASETIAASDSRDFINLVGHTRLDEAMALVKHASLVVGVDTGLTHMGTGFARPTVALFGSTCPYTDPGRSTTRVIYLGLPCAPCRRHPTCGGAFTCLREITPESVMTHVRAVMSTRAGEGS
ncbi:MAG: glycosyl transferase family 9 [Phycisphaerae bacterium]|nr:MAG: glycosyl transferase family 9 [Phycisphaerae bacterium]